MAVISGCDRCEKVCTHLPPDPGVWDVRDPGEDSVQDGEACGTADPKAVIPGVRRWLVAVEGFQILGAFDSILREADDPPLVRERQRHSRRMVYGCTPVTSATPVVIDPLETLNTGSPGPDTPTVHRRADEILDERFVVPLGVS